MAAYHYKAIDAKGSVQKGLLEGDSARQIRQQLREKSLLPVEVAAVNEQIHSKKWPQKTLGL